LPRSLARELPLATRTPECVDLAIVRIEAPIVGPGDRTSVRVHVLNSGTTSAKNVSVTLTDGSERSSVASVTRSLGDMPPTSIKSTTLALTYAITDSVRLGSLTIAVFTRSSELVADDGIRRSAAVPEQPAPVAVRMVGQIAS
jgi:hypothetical protein